MEKDINLAVSLDLRDLLRLWGFSVAMTRDTDISLESDGATVHERKVSDMRNRLEQYDRAKTVISIHQNYFSEAKYSGAQIFYSPNTAQSEQLAASVQKSIVALLQPQNTRERKCATDGIYLLYHTRSPAIIVECGFMSNPEECGLLKTTEYRQKMAFAIFAGIREYQMNGS